MVTSRRREPPPEKRKPKGSTVPELDYSRVWFSPEDIAAARRKAPEDLHDVLGLLPEQSDWYYDNDGQEGRKPNGA